MSHWLLRIPLAIIFIQQGLSKFPVTAEDAEAFELPYLVWWFVSYGELGAGIGLLVGGLFAAKLASIQKIVPELGKMVIWPPCWTHLHRSQVSPSEMKYILTGWMAYV